jgi:hypothetical protein
MHRAGGLHRCGTSLPAAVPLFLQHWGHETRWNAAHTLVASALPPCRPYTPVSSKDAAGYLDLVVKVGAGSGVQLWGNHATMRAVHGKFGSALCSCQADTMGGGWGAGGVLLWGAHATVQAGKFSMGPP